MAEAEEEEEISININEIKFNETTNIFEFNINNTTLSMIIDKINNDINNEDNESSINNEDNESSINNYINLNAKHNNSVTNNFCIIFVLCLINLLNLIINLQDTSAYDINLKIKNFTKNTKICNNNEFNKHINVFNYILTKISIDEKIQIILKIINYIKDKNDTINTIINIMKIKNTKNTKNK